MKRIARFACTVLVALSAAASNLQIVAGPEIQIGNTELGAWPFSEYLGTPALATNGDEILLVHSGRAKSLFGLRFDRHGTPLSSVPKPLLRATEDFELHFYNRIHVFWHQGSYVIFFLERQTGLHALRVTKDLEFLSLTPIASEAKVGANFDVATDGDDFVVVSRSRPALRLRGDLSIRAEISMADSYIPGPRGVAWGNGRFAIITPSSYAVSLQMLDGTTLSPARVVSSSNNRDGGAVDVAWTGSEFAAIWSECVEVECLISRARFAADGTSVGIARPLRYLRRATSSDHLAVTVVPLGDGVVLHLWDTTSSNGAAPSSTSWGMRYRGDTAIDEAPVDFGTRPVAAIRTSHDLLFTADGIMRVSVTPAPDVAPFPKQVPLQSATATTANHVALAAAASATEIAVIRRQWRHESHSIVATILGRDGRSVREIPLDAMLASVATDGQAFFVVTTDFTGVSWFSELREGAPRVRVGRYLDYSDSPRLVWTGLEFIVYALRGADYANLWFQRVTRDGRLSGDLTAIEGTNYYGSRIIRTGGELLLTWRGQQTGIRRLTLSGVPMEDPQMVEGTASTAALAWNGRTEALMYDYPTSTWTTEEIRLAFRSPGGSFVTIPDRGGSPGPGRYVAYGGELAAAGDSFVGVYGSWATSRGFPRTHAVLFDEKGVLDAKVVAMDGVVSQLPGSLLGLSETEFLVIYTRPAFEDPHAGASRVFARVLTIAPAGRRRAVR